ncbi:hypothetical protein PR003_g2728 [Phytophthora rubi]|uniref:Uncharacterized protein n=1 Tax=Phytophthora rubi TaxID=129364 RepID=A0A6A3P643_9STRA|nr:hypothetical protein PR002_g1923 [Phytophthora rubi]KAE9051003.1 hypothetical protein PR001_g1848 [Phytophthora rubi]KAE9355669.1 hypothetical protein PR003_g2728 [Phytophthora rubi]
MESSSSSVQTLIDQFELMAQTNAAPAAPRSWPVAGAKKTALPPQPKSDNSPVKEIIDYLNTQRARTQSEPVQMLQKTETTPEVSEPAKEQPPEEEAESKPATPTKFALKNLTVKTLQFDDDDDTKTLNSYDDESDADSTMTTKSTCYSIVPRSPSSFSTASTGSLDSLLSSLDMFLPEFLQPPGETSSESMIIKPTVYHSRRSSLPENLQPTPTSKLIPPTSYRRASLSGKSPSVTNETGIPTAPKPRRSPLYMSRNPAPAASTPARPRRASLSATMAPPPTKSTRRFSESTGGAQPVVARGRSNSTSVPRYMDYDSSPRFAATKARNLEHRRQLEERSRNLAADKSNHAASKTPRRPRTPEWQGRLNQVRSRLFDSKEDNQSRATKATTTRRHSTSSRV